MGRAKAVLSGLLMGRPRVFDRVKRATRALGDRGTVYDFLTEFDRRHPHCRFLQIGANNGMMQDPLREFIVRGRWTGILVEPVPYLFRELRENYGGYDGLHFVNAAVSDAVGLATFFSVRQGERVDSGVGSLYRSHVIGHMAEGLDPDAVIEPIEVPTTTVQEILRSHGFEQIDLLHMDVEGHEADILASIDFTTVRPWAIILESRHLKDRKAETFALLARHGYRVQDDGEDAIATR